MQRHLKFRRIAGSFAACRLPANAVVPDWATRGAFTSVTRSAKELSIVCPVENVPSGQKHDAPWICFELVGPFDFSQVGILSSFIGPLAESGVPIFAVSTYDTDYVLIRKDSAEAALGALKAAGHELIPATSP